jgi:hypothetical protein
MGLHLSQGLRTGRKALIGFGGDRLGYASMIGAPVGRHAQIPPFESNPGPGRPPLGPVTSRLGSETPAFMSRGSFETGRYVNPFPQFRHLYFDKVDVILCCSAI